MAGADFRTLVPFANLHGYALPMCRASRQSVGAPDAGAVLTTRQI